MSMREISENEAFAMAGEADCPVLMKEENEPMEAAVCLKQFPQGYVLGASDKVKDLRLWFTEDFVEAETEYQRLLAIMLEQGSPLAE